MNERTKCTQTISYIPNGTGAVTLTVLPGSNVNGECGPVHTYVLYSVCTLYMHGLNLSQKSMPVSESVLYTCIRSIIRVLLSAFDFCIALVLSFV